MNHIANIITISRILCSISLIFIEPFTLPFWAIYMYCGISDMLDGYCARKSKILNQYGAQLDSFADIIFTLSISYCIVFNLYIPLWAYIVIFIVFVIRFITYCIEYIKFKSFYSLHTYLNKVSGLIIFLGLFVYFYYPYHIVFLIIIIVSLGASIEELIIIMNSKEIDFDCKGLKTNTKS